MEKDTKKSLGLSISASKKSPTVLRWTVGEVGSFQIPEVGLSANSTMGQTRCFFAAR